MSAAGVAKRHEDHEPLPQNIEAEQALLGAVLVNNAAFRRVEEVVEAAHFIEPVHGRIFDAVAKLIERGQVANPVTLKNLFDQDGALAEVGGAQYLARLAASAVTIINAKHYAETIQQLFVRRQEIALGWDWIENARQVDVDEDQYDERRAQIVGQLLALTGTSRKRASMRTFREALADAAHAAEASYKRGGQLAGITTGLVDVDRLLGGLHPSDLVVLAGRPSMGKTSLAMNICGSAASSILASESSQRVAFFTLEMSDEQIASRAAAARAGLPSDAVRTGKLNEDGIARFIEATQELSDLPIDIAGAVHTISGIMARARELKRQRGLALVIIDYLQLVDVDGGGRRPENRVQEISEITRGLKALAKELDVPVIALSQLSREVEKRPDKRPLLSDLRDSGTIEQDADVVMFLYREEYYLSRSEPTRSSDETDERFNERHERWQSQLDRTRSLAELIIAKNRHGPVDKIVMRFDHVHTRFEDLAAPDRLPDRFD